jgi:hypothetical protein
MIYPRMTGMARQGSVKTKLKLAFGVTIFGLLLELGPPPPAMAQSLPGVVVRSVVQGTIRVPAGQRVVVAGVKAIAPSDLTHGSYLTTAFIYVSAAANTTTCTLDLSGGAVAAPLITLPPTATVFIPFEDAGDYNKGSSPSILINQVGVIAGAAGDVIVHPPSGIKLILVSTTTASTY